MAREQQVNDVQISYDLGKEEGLRIAKLDKFKATQEWVNKWRKDNGVGPNVSPSKDIVPFKWMHPFLHKVQTDSSQVAHGTHKAEDGWAQPWDEKEGGERVHPREDHKQYDPSGGELYNPLDGGDVERWGPQHEMLIQNMAGGPQNQLTVMFNPNDKPQRMFKVTDKDKQLNNPAWQRFMEGNPNYMYVPLQKAGLYFGEQIPNQKDKAIKDAINKYGKKDGKYQNPEMLIKSLPKA